MKYFTVFLNKNILPHFLSPFAFVSEPYAVRDINERLAHGRQLKIYLPKSAEKLEFIPAFEPGKTFLYWKKDMFRSETLGNSSGTGFGCCFDWCVSMRLFFNFL